MDRRAVAEVDLADGILGQGDDVFVVSVETIEPDVIDSVQSTPKVPSDDVPSERLMASVQLAPLPPAMVSLPSPTW
jgi:hypothetical protein